MSTEKFITLARDFLMLNGAYEWFVEHLRENKDSYSFDDLVAKEPLHWMQCGFVWCDTKEGIAYWYPLYKTWELFYLAYTD